MIKIIFVTADERRLTQIIDQKRAWEDLFYICVYLRLSAAIRQLPHILGSGATREH
jgi:hypothetical protein